MAPDSPGAGGADTAGLSGDRAERLGRLLWRCRRGMKELDLLLERFARQVLPQAPPTDWDSFEALLALPDPVLADYLLAGSIPPRTGIAELVIQVREGMNFYPRLQSTRSGSAR